MIAAMSTTKTYFEDFNDGPGGWHTRVSNAAGPGRLNIHEGAVVCQSPWWVDYNHAPPGGAGYLHLLMGLRTRDDYPRFAAETSAMAGNYRFVNERHGTDFRGAKLTLRLRGHIDLRGAQLVYHVQFRVGPRWINYALTGKPFMVTSDWSEQSVTLDVDPAQWTCLGARHGREDFYGSGPLEDVLRDVNGNMILVLFPLQNVPATRLNNDDDLHKLRAGEDYELDRSKLPEGYVMFDWVRIESARSLAKETHA